MLLALQGGQVSLGWGTSFRVKKRKETEVLPRKPAI